jgi:hypothetical protein
VNQAQDTARNILQTDRDLLDKLSVVLIEREVVDGDELRRYVEGKASIPTRHELQLEAEQKRSSNGHEGTDEITGPDLIASAPSKSVPTQEVPARPD